MHFGPVALQPHITVTNVGVDTNVFNRATNAVRDTTATLVPGLSAWLLLNHVRLSSQTTAEVVYFNHAHTERSTALSEQLHLDVRFTRLTPFAGFDRLATYQRPNAELDVRVRRETDGVLGGVTFQVSSRLRLEARMTQSHLRFTDAEAAGFNLSQELDRRTTLVGASARLTLTSITAFVVRTEVQQDRFDHDPLRDTDSVAIVPGFEFKPRSILSGTAEVGYRRFVPKSSALPAFSGVVGGVDLHYLWREMTRYGVRFTRNVDYSFETDAPYFLQTGVGFSVTQLIFGTWDCVGRASTDRLAYEHLRVPALPSIDLRVDRAQVLGAGVGYHFGFGGRLGIDVNREWRQSVVEDRRYNGLRVGGSFTYGY